MAQCSTQDTMTSTSIQPKKPESNAGSACKMVREVQAGHGTKHYGRAPLYGPQTFLHLRRPDNLSKFLSAIPLFFFWAISCSLSTLPVFKLFCRRQGHLSQAISIAHNTRRVNYLCKANLTPLCCAGTHLSESCFGKDCSLS